MRRILSGPRAGGIVLLGAAALWLPLCWRWARAWSASPDQAFGWGVPLLAAYLLWERWRRAPAPGAVPPAGRGWAATILAAGLLLTAASVPVLETNVLWPTAQWWSALAAALALFGACAWAGGFRWGARFVFPPLFLLTALTWPTPVKVWIVESLSHANATVAADVVTTLGHPALVSGNVIAVSTGLVGIAEACSGLRSLQAVWMLAWFLGEFFLLNLPRRLFLVGASVAVALVTNFARTVFLTYVAAAAGIPASERWHDRAGNVELAIGLLAVCLLAWRGHRPRRERRPDADLPGRGEAARLAGPRPSPRIAVPLRRPPEGSAASSGTPGSGAGAGTAAALTRLVPAALAALVVMAAAEAGTQAWYGAHERVAGTQLVHWRLASAAPGWTPVAVPPREVQVLGSSDAEGLQRAPSPDAPAAWLFLVNWEGDAARGENPEWHDPAVCLPAAGARLVGELGVTDVTIAGRALPFHGYRFDTEAGPLTVYFCHWDAETARARAELPGAADDPRARRWQRVREGRRQGDVAHIAFLVGTDSPAAALARVREWAPELLHPVAG